MRIVSVIIIQSVTCSTIYIDKVFHEYEVPLILQDDKSTSAGKVIMW